VNPPTEITDLLAVVHEDVTVCRAPVAKILTAPEEALPQINEFMNRFYYPAKAQAKAIGYGPGEAYLVLTVKTSKGAISKYFDLVAGTGGTLRFYLGHWARSKAKCFFNLGYRNADLGEYKRGSYEHVIGYPGIWLDIDIAGSNHVEKRLPQSLEEAKNLVIEAMPDNKPTHLVYSGGGLHVYWLFNTPWFFKDEEEKTAAQSLLRGLYARTQTAAQKHGWKIDNCSDLARLLRVPGTYNMKDPSNPRLVEISEWN